MATLALVNGNEVTVRVETDKAFDKRWAPFHPAAGIERRVMLAAAADAEAARHPSAMDLSAVTRALVLKRREESVLINFRRQLRAIGSGGSFSVKIMLPVSSRRGRLPRAASARMVARNCLRATAPASCKCGGTLLQLIRRWHQTMRKTALVRAAAAVESRVSSLRYGRPRGPPSPRPSPYRNMPTRTQCLPAPRYRNSMRLRSRPLLPMLPNHRHPPRWGLAPPRAMIFLLSRRLRSMSTTFRGRLTCRNFVMTARASDRRD